MLCLKLNKPAFGKLCTSDAHGITLIQTQCLHHPIWEVNNPLLGDELENASMSGGSRVLRVPKLKHPRGFKIK